MSQSAFKCKANCFYQPRRRKGLLREGQSLWIKSARTQVNTIMKLATGLATRFLVLFLLNSNHGLSRSSEDRAGRLLETQDAIFAGKNERSSAKQLKRESIKVFGSFRITSTCGSDVDECPGQRRKRSIDLDNEPDFTLHITTDQEVGSLGKEIKIRLKRSMGLVAPHFKLVVRDGDSIEVNRTVPYPTCLYAGHVSSTHGDTDVAMSTCHRNRLSGIVVTEDTKLTVEQVDHEHKDFDEIRKKRFASDHDNDGHIVIFESEASGGECGLKQWNTEKMTAPRKEAIALSQIAKDDVPDDATMFVRKKRQSSGDKAIELAVFVDDDMYLREVAKSSDPVADIQDLVFTYLNSVQLLYNSRILTTQFRLILVRLEVFKSRIRSIDKAGGDIERYLDSFCGWQKNENPGANNPINADRQDPDHWDHGLLLTGLDLYDQNPTMDSVIGLAWVSGMCHPAYSCTINEGNNFESVFVIAHEMGHNLGMNHDGERREGNDCNPDKYLMSPILGPGKVTWSQCSNREILAFLNGRTTRGQAACLNDLPTVMDHYDYLKEQIAPGEKFSALEQCKRAFGPNFVPHVQPNTPPFEDLCRELWCANFTHALRAHPALEGTDCSSKPYPYGSICIGGICSKFDPDTPLVATYGADGGKDGSGTAGSEETRPQNEPNPNVVTASREKDKEDPNRPEWYDPIFNEIFQDLRTKISEKYLSFPNVRVVPVKALHQDDHLVDEFGVHPPEIKEAAWAVKPSVCPVKCGGGWMDVSVECNQDGLVVNSSKCLESQRPQVTKATCNINPC